MNESIRLVMVQHLMQLYRAIKHLELEKQSKVVVVVDNVDRLDDGSSDLLRMYHEQRNVLLNFGISQDEIMVAALDVMKEMCGSTIKNIPHNLPRHNPFSQPKFLMALAKYQKNTNSNGGYLVDNEIYVTAPMFLLNEKKSTKSRLLPKFFSSSQWKPIRVVLQQKKLEVFDAKIADSDILSGLSTPKFMIEMHRLLSLTPLKVYASDNSAYGKEIFSLSIVETDEKRKNAPKSSEPDKEEQELVRFGVANNPEQFTFFQTTVRSILDSFHN